jgi:hypothetical protein
MIENWYKIPYFSLLGMYALGIISEITANWLFGKYKHKRGNSKEYFTVTIQNNNMQFEGRNKISYLQKN